MDRKNIAWDGISFDVPPVFEVSGIDKRFLQLDNGEQPCIELRWYDAGRTYKEKTYFRQLAKKIESASGLKIESTVLPSSWKSTAEKVQHHCLLLAVRPRHRTRGNVLL